MSELQTVIERQLGGRIVSCWQALDETTVSVHADQYLDVLRSLRDEPDLRFDTLVDLCGMDYRDYREGGHEGPRFAVVLHLLSVELNQRLRVRVFCPDDDFPVVASATPIWTAAGWYEREAFDLYGIVFEGHDDLRRILTDYGFVAIRFVKTSRYLAMLRCAMTRSRNGSSISR